MYSTYTLCVSRYAQHEIFAVQDVMQPLFVVTIISGQPIDPFFKDQAWLLNIGRIRCPETSVLNYQLTRHNILEERRSLSQCGRILKAGMYSMCPVCM